MGGTTISLTNKLIKIEYYLELDRVENSSDLGFITSLIFEFGFFGFQHSQVFRVQVVGVSGLRV